MLFCYFNYVILVLVEVITMQVICARCKKVANPHIMSMFNTDLICMDCKEKERQRPDYRDAVKADIEEIKKGNYNFQGIGY